MDALSDEEMDHDGAADGDLGADADDDIFEAADPPAVAAAFAAAVPAVAAAVPHAFMMLDDEVQIDEYAEEQDDGRVPSQYASIDIGEHLGRIGDRLLRHNVRRCLQRAGERSKVVLDAYRERDSAENIALPPCIGAPARS